MNLKRTSSLLIRPISCTPLRQADAAPAASSSDGEIQPFQHANAEALFHKMIKLNVEDIGLVGQLMTERLGIEFTEADLLGKPAAGASGESTEEDVVEEVKTHFDLKLTGFDAKSKIKVIKEIRAITSLGLKEAKAMVDGAPKVVKKEIKKDEAEELKVKLEAIGATVEIV